MHFLSTLVFGLTTFLGATNADKIVHCTEPNTIALTFDDGPYEYTTDLLDQLKSANIKATFFINGYNWWKDLESDSSKQQVIKRTIEEGHQVASHTWAHQIPEEKEDIKKALSKLDDLVEKAAGVRPKYFRAPQGHCDKDCIEYIESLGYKLIHWDTDTNDWDYNFKGLKEKEGREKRVEMVKKFLTKKWSEEKENYLVLMHDVQVHTVKSIIPWLVKNAPFDKYKFVTVAECLGDRTGAYSGDSEIIKTYIPANTTDDALNNTITTDNNTITDNLRATSGAFSVTYSSNILAFVTLLVYSIYLLF